MPRDTHTCMGWKSAVRTNSFNILLHHLRLLSTLLSIVITANVQSAIVIVLYLLTLDLLY